ncbi:unnamed protein product [Angiostrongylus costaricensis]|uniref:G_PROTEIN_RECEP_F1_2 domain-containing protein n=1 Tax=Angiostrongylus costaricensis TaxID=334426 RepID=A0A0R3PEQ2_ANGCS|nr:unnamed protein product [Angiostrongylus costaricensis]
MALYNEAIEFERKIGIIIAFIFALIIVIGVVGNFLVVVVALSQWTCIMINFFQHASAYCSVWTLMLMALDRYLAVVYPVDSLTLRSPKNAVIALAVVFAVPIGLMHGIYAYDFFTEVRSTCAIVSIATSTATLTFARTYFITFNVFGYILPLGISALLYWRMLRRLWRTQNPGHASKVSIQ